MCWPVVVGAVMAVASIANNISANKATKKQQRAIEQQNQIRAEEIQKRAGQEMTERARAARRERGSARAAASGANINLDSGSFLAQLQTSEMNQYNDQGLIVYNERQAQKARKAETDSYLSRLSYKTGLGIALDAGAAFAGGYTGAGGATYMGNNPGRG